MLGLIGGLMVAAAGWSVGEHAAHELYLREEHLKELGELLDRIEIYLSSYRMSSEEIFGRICSGGGVYGSLFAVSGRDITAEIAARIRTSGAEMGEELADYIESFGSTDLEGQLAQNRLLRFEVKKSFDQARDRRERFSKIYRTAGISAGLTVALLLI